MSAAVTGYPRYETGTCFPSSRLMALRFPELAYVEGDLVIVSGDVEMRIPHAWNESAGNEVVDSTSQVPEGMITRYEVQRRWTCEELADALKTLDGGLMAAGPIPEPADVGKVWTGLGWRSDLPGGAS